MSDPVDLGAPELYINRELAALEFNFRVLAQARDPDVPALERLRYLTIVSNNLDEYFEVRVAVLKHKHALGAAVPGADGLSVRRRFFRASANGRWSWSPSCMRRGTTNSCRHWPAKASAS